MVRGKERNAISNWRSSFNVEKKLLRPFSILSWIRLSLSLAVQVRLGSTNFASFGAHSSPFIPCVVFSPRTIHGVPGSHASALTATIHRFILFLRQRLFVTPLRDTRRRGGGKNVGEETVKNKRKPSLRWKNEKKKEREREIGRRLEPRNYGAWRDGYFLAVFYSIGRLLRFQPFSASMVAATLPKSRPPFDNDIKIYRNPAGDSMYRYFCAPVPFVPYFPCNQ